MFARAQRLGKSSDVQRTLQKGRRASAGPVRCSLVSRPKSFRVTVIISKKTAKLAVTRNLVKRRVRSALRDLSLPEGDLIISLFTGSPTLSYLELHQALATCLARFS